MPSACEIKAKERSGAGLRRRHVPLHQVIGKIRERIAERRQFPIEHGRDFRLARREDHIVEPVVAMNEPRRLRRRQMLRQPGDQLLHLLDTLRLRRAILLRPALDLPRHIVFAAAIIAKPDRRRIECVQPRQRRVHGVIDARALRRIGSGHLRLPEHAALDMRHDEEGGADHGFVGAIEHRLGDRKALAMERADDAEFAIDRMRRGQQFSRRLSPQHVAPRRRFDEIGRIGLAALELADRGRAGKARHLVAQIDFEPRHIEAQPLGDVPRARKGVLAITHRTGL